MRKIINSTIISLDGVIDNPGRWSLSYFGDDTAEFASRLLLSSDALLMGRRTYEGFAASWPHMEATESEFAVRMNTLPKYVASTTLTDPEWNNSQVIEGDALEFIRQLKAEPGENILMYGYGPLARLLVANGLLDELHLLVHPVMLGQGEQIFHEGSGGAFSLVNARQLKSGVMVLSYQLA
jgi:dihydrofolate reductase